MLRTNASAALRYIPELLNANSIPFQVVGGLAAHAYGSSRPLADIDLCVSGEQLARIASLVSNKLIRPPSPHRDPHWGMTVMALEVNGQRIEIGAAEGRYYDREAGRWRVAGVDFRKSESREVLCVVVPVMPLAQLLEYKKGLGRGWI